MSISDFHADYKKQLLSQYPQLPNIDISKLISPYQLKLPIMVLQQVKLAIKAFYQCSRSKDYLQNISTEDKEILSFKSNQASVLMAYDFHFDGESVKLIEINTNASGFLFAEALYQTHAISTKALSLLKASFKTEMPDATKILALIDENVLHQKMYAEFLMYQQLFTKWGYKCSIENFDELKLEGHQLVNNTGRAFDFIYNRHTDFLFSENSAQHLRQAYLNKLCVFSPHPREYEILAHKQRLIDLSLKLNDLDLPEKSKQAIAQVLIFTQDIKTFDKDELWQKKKGYFFKPKKSYGSKSTYRGRSISRKVFDRLYQEESLVQTYTPPSQVEWGDQKWKYDLRFYVYRDQIQLMAGRLYQGQVTNFNTKGGGFCTIEFK